MALTTDQLQALFSILEVPYCTTRYELSEDGMTHTSEIIGASWAAKTAIEAHLAAMDAGTEAVLVTLITKWIAIRFSTVAISGGSVGGVSGLDMNPNATRALLQREVTVLVPFLRAHERAGVGGGADDSLNIQVLR